MKSLVLLLALALACGGGDGVTTLGHNPADTALGTTIVRPTSATLNVGDSLLFVSTFVGPAGKSKAVRWSASNSNVSYRQINDTSAYVYALFVGSAQITTSAKEDAEKFAAAQVTMLARPDSIIITSSTIMRLGYSQVVTATYRGHPLGDGEVFWSTSNSAVASIDARGQLTARSLGTCTISAQLRSGGVNPGSAPIIVVQ